MRHKVKAGALTLVLAISIIVAAILGSLVMLVYYNRISLLRTEVQQNLKTNARSGLQLLLAKQHSKKSIPNVVDLFGDGEDTVFLSSEPWGVYDALVSMAQSGSHIETIAALSGVQSQQDLGLALYLCEEERPLALSGKTLLKGDVKLPSVGVKTAYIEGTGFLGNKLVHGQVMESSSSLPNLNPILLNRIYFYCRRNFPGGLQHFPQQLENKSFQFSFAGEGSILASQQAIRLANLDISGKVIIVSEKEVTVAKTAQLEDVLITAPIIRVEKGFKGSLQLFATDSVIVEEDSQLVYPSAVCLYSKGEGARIRAEKGSQVEGLVLLVGEGERLNDRIDIQQNAKITGHVYSDGFVQHQGIINGGLYCRRLLYKTKNVLYENYLVNATVDASTLPPDFLAADMLGAENKWGVVKWLK